MPLPLSATLLLLACAPAPEPQPALALHLVVHVDPLPRRDGEDCEDDRLRSCGRLSPDPWRERIDNLRWLSDRWVQTGRAMDLQWGPEMALTLAEDPDHVASLVEGYAADGHPDPDAAVAEGIAVGQDAVQQAVDAGVAAFAVHVHTVARDPSGLWGAGPLAGGDGPHPCDAFAGDPLAEAPLDVVEGIVHYGALGGAAVSERFGAELRSLTGSVPRTMGGKALALSDPDALDPDVDRDWPDAFTPWLLGGAYSECMIRATGHPPFELYRAGEERSLGGGEGPLVHPGEPVVGSMDQHLDLPADGAPGAAARRLLVALLAWRYASLSGEATRPWAYSVHTHLFHLDQGEVAANDPEARLLRAIDGSPFRHDLEAFAAFADRYTGAAWQGVGADDGGGPVAWTLPDETDLDADFVYGDADAAPPSGMDESYPYPEMPARVLADSHLRCSGTVQGVELHGLDHCAAGWAWGGDAPGFHCADLAPPAARYVLVPPRPTCVEDIAGLARAGAIGDVAMGTGQVCGTAGLWVPSEGLLLAAGAPLGVLESACTQALVPEGNTGGAGG